MKKSFSALSSSRGVQHPVDPSCKWGEFDSANGAAEAGTLHVYLGMVFTIIR